jgi:hypothetical protein
VDNNKPKKLLGTKKDSPISIIVLARHLRHVALCIGLTSVTHHRQLFNSSPPRKSWIEYTTFPSIAMSIDPGNFEKNNRQQFIEVDVALKKVDGKANIAIITT